MEENKVFQVRGIFTTAMAIILIIYFIFIGITDLAQNREIRDLKVQEAARSQAISQLDRSVIRLEQSVSDLAEAYGVAPVSVK